MANLDEIFDSKIELNEKKQISWSGKLLIGLTGGIAVGFSILCAPFITPAFRKYCLPYVPATTSQVDNVLSVLKNTQKGRLLDIGSGDGRIVIATAKQGFQSDGVELNPWLVQYSRFSSLLNGVRSNTQFFCKDLWKFDIKPYNYVVIFGVEQMMEELERKIKTETENLTLIACRFPLPNLKPNRTIGSGVDQVWIYYIRNKL